MPLQYWSITQPKTAIQAFNSESVSLVGIKKQPDGETIAKAFLSVIVGELIEAFNVGKTMDKMQLGFSVNGIESDYYFLKIDELKYCFEQAKKGRYGTMYDRIDAAVIFGWLDKYLEERTEIAYLQNIEKNKLFKKEEVAPGIVEILAKAAKKTISDPVNMDLVTPQPRKLTEQEQTVQDIFKEFDELHRDKPYDSNERVRTIPYQNENITQDQFLFIRLEEIKTMNEL